MVSEIMSEAMQHKEQSCMLSLSVAGSLQSVQESPSSGTATAYDLDFLARISGEQTVGAL